MIVSNVKQVYTLSSSVGQGCTTTQTYILLRFIYSMQWYLKGQVHHFYSSVFTLDRVVPLHMWQTLYEAFVAPERAVGNLINSCQVMSLHISTWSWLLNTKLAPMSITQQWQDQSEKTGLLICYGFWIDRWFAFMRSLVRWVCLRHYPISSAGVLFNSSLLHDWSPHERSKINCGGAM